ncbi:methyltransferase-like protein 25 [Scaptodrosophila lebanonensis]|uniref:Methyltransferase-like protein 25 n=1 Tax=Drosophila lebanonensis TaxID=7225 RepID=A0A6J2TCI4_DROLE|nr:methyltransferase-like protein 25 [Scaptodrosophila lebanonensis]
MTSCNVKQIQQRLDGLLAYMQPHWSFVNCHMVNYITDEHWEHFVPQKLRVEVPTATDVKQCIETLFWKGDRQTQQFPEFASFLAAGELQRLTCSDTELLTTVEDLEKQLLDADSEQATLSIKEFMSAKKCHEVEITAALVHKLIESASKKQDNDFYIVDAGDGKGYLSSRLALQYYHRVLGIDANAKNTENALARNSKLQRAWNGLTVRAELQGQGITPKRRGKNATKECGNPAPKLDNYKTSSKFITTQLDLCALLDESFPEQQVDKMKRICLTGLHTCGNLAATCLQVFDAQPNCEILCNIGCCYHLLKERYSDQEFFGNKALMDMQTEYGFPLSDYLRERNVCLGRNARMLAAQSMERTQAAKELPNITLYYRALIELLVCRHAPHLKNELQVGKVRKFQNFYEYVQLCAKKLNATWLGALEEAELEELARSCDVDRHYLELFYLLRMSFAPVLESLILLDRLLYLKERGHKKSYLVNLFDAVISPRHYAIVAFKSH